MACSSRSTAAGYRGSTSAFLAARLRRRPLRPGGVFDGPTSARARRTLRERAAGAPVIHLDAVGRPSGPFVPMSAQSAALPRVEERPAALAVALDLEMDSPGTKRTSGGGPGLALLARAAEVHGGTVEFTEPAGGGAVFRINLPAVPPGRAAA